MAAKKRTQSHPVHSLDLRQPPVDPEEMGFAFGVFQAGLRLRMPMESPATKGIPIESREEGEWLLDPLPPDAREELFTIREGRVSPKDIPFHRAVFGVLDHYKDHPQREAISTRLHAFYFLFNDSHESEHWKKWQKPSDDPESEYVLIHPAVIEAMATVPLGRYGNFNLEEFFGTVEKIAREKYTDE